MAHHLEDSLSLLSRTPAALDALLRDLPDAWTRRDEGDQTWSAFDVVGHLIHCEHTDWMPRARMILQSGDTRPFEPFDRWGHAAAVQGKTLPQLLDELSDVRARNIAEVRGWHLSADQLAQRGLHPALGPVTLSELLATWAAHDLTHLHQITRVMAHQYQGSVGPWVKFLGVMRCAGHGS
jgi:DinB superfamily